jgi:hypothetical protein
VAQENVGTRKKISNSNPPRVDHAARPEGTLVSRAKTRRSVAVIILYQRFQSSLPLKLRVSKDQVVYLISDSLGTTPR